MAVILSNQSLGSVLLEASNREPAMPASDRPFLQMNGLGKGPKVFGVATSGVSTGASERLPDWPSQPQMEERGDFPTTNGARLVPQAAVPGRTSVWLCAAIPTQTRSCASLLAAACPERTADNSPAFQRCEAAKMSTASLKGMTEVTALTLHYFSAAPLNARPGNADIPLVTHHDPTDTRETGNQVTRCLICPLRPQLSAAADSQLRASSPPRTLC
jgi:hypothetical protein